MFSCFLESRALAHGMVTGKDKCHDTECTSSSSPPCILFLSVVSEYEISPWLVCLSYPGFSPPKSVPNPSLLGHQVGKRKGLDAELFCANDSRMCYPDCCLSDPKHSTSLLLCRELTHPSLTQKSRGVISDNHTLGKKSR